MAILLAAATTMELAAALEWSGLPLPSDEGRIECLELPGHDSVLALATGIGPINAALGLGLALGSHELHGVINLGVAGSFDLERLPLCSVAVASSEAWPEFGLHGQAGLDPRGLGLAQARTPDGPVYEHMDLVPEAHARTMGLRLADGWVRIHGLTVAGVSGCPDRAQELRARHASHAPAMESMEGFALALGCLRAGLPFLEIRTISNAVGLRPPTGWDLPGALRALGHAAQTLLRSSHILEEKPC